MAEYDGVIFDMDGVILDSGLNGFEWMDKIRMKKASELGYEIDQEDSYQLVHSSDPSQLDELLSRKGMSIQEAEEIEHRVQNAKISLVEHGAIRLYPEAEKLLDQIDRPVGLATNSPRKTAEFVLRYFGIESKFDTVEAVALEPIKNYIRKKKPNTYMLDNIIEDEGLENPVMIGDTSTDVKAAEKAEIDSILVSNNGKTGVDPTYKVRDLSEARGIIGL